MTEGEVGMLIKERLAIPIKTRESPTSLKLCGAHSAKPSLWPTATRSFSGVWWVILGALLLASVALRDIALKTFGLDLSQTLMELALTALVICLPAIILMGIVAVVWHVLKWDTGHGILLSGIALLPLIIFLLYAHLEMSRALAPLKLEFNECAAMHGDQGIRTASLVAITKTRDRRLAEYGYIRLGGWRTSGNVSDCTAVYLFVGAF